jgi:hypothetical protein
MKTHVLCSITFSENRTVYEIMSKHLMENEGPQMTSKHGAYTMHAALSSLYTRMRMHTSTRQGKHMHARTHKQAHTDQNVILIAFSLQQRFRERASMLHYTYAACIVLICRRTPQSPCLFSCHKYKVVQIWPGLFVCKQVTVCPGHIWTTLYPSITSDHIQMLSVY